jgi:hypothetical protein
MNIMVLRKPILEFICLPVFDENLLAYKLLKLEKYVSH